MSNALILADTRPALIGNILLQIQKTNIDIFDEVIIYHIGISENDKNIFNSILHCRFIYYDPKIPVEIMKLERFKYFSILMFARYEIFKYLNEFDTVTWLDTDIIIQKNLKDMILLAMRTGMALIREDPKNKTAQNYDIVKSCFTQNINNYNMDTYLYCSGTIIITQKLIKNELYTEWCYKKTIEWANFLILPDQGILNLLIQHYDIKVTVLNGRKYCCFPDYKRNCRSASIIHAWGPNKFWNDWYLNLSIPVWREYYGKWIALNGSQLELEFSPKITVLIPTYKPNFTYFKECIESLINQKQNFNFRYSDFEILVIAEPINKYKLIKFIEKFKDPRIKLIFNEKRLGISSSLNKGIREAKGEYIARIDDDDIASGTRLYKQVQYLNRQNKVTLCTSNFQYFGNINENRVSFEGKMSHAWSIFTCPFDHPTIMIRKEFILKNNLFYNENYSCAEDWELWIRAFRKGMIVGNINEILTLHRWHKNNSSSNIETENTMNKLATINFYSFVITVPDDLKTAIRPWQGITDSLTLIRIKNIFELILEKNKISKIYDQESLDKAFTLRLFEAKTGIIPEISSSILSGNINYKESFTKMIIKRIIKKILRPIYRPLYNKYEVKINSLERKISDLNDNLNSLFKEMFEHVSNTAFVNSQYILNANLQTELHKQLLNVLVSQSENIIYHPNEKIRIVFLYQIPSFWPSWDSLWQSCSNDTRLDIQLVLYDGIIKEVSQVKNSEEFLIKNKIPYISFKYFNWQNFSPHIVIYQTPYDSGHRPPYLWASTLRLKGYRIVYIPYGIEISDTTRAQKDHFMGNVTQYAWRIYTFSEIMQSQYLNYISPPIVKALGHPKFDVFFNQSKPILSKKIDNLIKNRKIVLWKIHFPKIENLNGKKIFYTPELKEYLAFTKYLKEFDDFFFIFMPHPKFFQVSELMEDNGEAARNLFHEVSLYKNIYIYEDEDYRAPLISAGYVIVDRSAIMIEAGSTGVPVLYMSNVENYEPLTKAVEPLVRSYYQGSTCQDMVDFLNMCRNGLDPKKDERKAAFKECIPMFDGKAGERIKEDMIQGLISEY